MTKRQTAAQSEYEAAVEKLDWTPYPEEVAEE